MVVQWMLLVIAPKQSLAQASRLACKTRIRRIRAREIRTEELFGPQVAQMGQAELLAFGHERYLPMRTMRPCLTGMCLWVQAVPQHGVLMAIFLEIPLLWIAESFASIMAGQIVTMARERLAPSIRSELM